jgi:hypothetical protein
VSPLENCSCSSQRVQRLNQECQAAPTDPAEWKIEKTFQFNSGHRAYRLIHSRTLDASGSICLGAAGSLRPVGTKYWQNAYLDRVDRLSPRIFTFQIHIGNGTPTIYRKYKLDLSRPQRPKITFIKTWTED